MQVNHEATKSITDLELARRYKTDKIDVEVKEFEFSIEIGKIQIRLTGVLSGSIERIILQARGRGLYLTIAVVGLVALITAIANLIS